MDGISSLLVVKALDGLYARQLATAQNIANANSDNYHPIQVTFEDSLRAAAAGGPDDIAGVTPQTVLAPWQPGDEMRLDLEIATASQTALRFSALIGVLDRQMQIARTVVSGGR